MSDKVNRDKKEGTMSRLMISLRKEEIDWVKEKSRETEAPVSGVIRLLLRKAMEAESGKKEGK